MKLQLKNDFARIVMSFIRAFVGASILMQGADIHDLRGVQGFLVSAAVAGIAAALRTAETVFAVAPSDSSEG
jgi:hypothetical protein